LKVGAMNKTEAAYESDLRDAIRPSSANIAMVLRFELA
jgi:hypothetical protein